jgi:hypothetical protein
MNLLYSKSLCVQEDGGVVGEVKVGGENALLGDGHTCQVTTGSDHGGGGRGGQKGDGGGAEDLKIGYTHVIASDYVATPGLPVDLPKPVLSCILLIICMYPPPHMATPGVSVDLTKPTLSLNP